MIKNIQESYLHIFVFLISAIYLNTEARPATPDSFSKWFDVDPLAEFDGHEKRQYILRPTKG